jgi:hypothetical protein
MEEANVLKEFTIGFCRTINLGNFESAKVQASVTFEIGDFGQAQAAHIENVEAHAQRTLRRLLETTYKAQMKKTPTKPTEEQLK